MVPALTPVLDLLIPPRCPSCGARTDPPWCGPCGDRVVRIPPGGCGRCGDGAAPHRCWDDRVHVTRTVVALRYEGVAAAAVVAGKVRGARTLWRPLGELLGAAVLAARLEIEVVTWVPADRDRLRERGFDHAALLAEGVAASVGLPRCRLLDATPGRPDQANRSIATRRTLPVSAFRPTRSCRGARVLLVDDVLTTGATVRVAAAALRRAGAPPVHVAALARAGQHALGRAR